MNQLKKKQNQRRQKREILVEEDNNLARIFDLATNNKIYVNRLHLHETKKKLGAYTGEFELIGFMLLVK